jgi:tetratricopeptide (TPR) repeat protein
LEAEDTYSQGSELGSLELAIEGWKQILSDATFESSDPTFQLATLNKLGELHRRRYVAAGQVQDIATAVQFWDKALAQSHRGSPERAGFLNNLGLAQGDIYSITGNIRNLEGAVNSFERAVTEALPGSPDLPRFISNLGSWLRERYLKSRKFPDLERALVLLHQAVDLTQQNSSDLALRLHNLGLGLVDFYYISNNLSNLEEAIQLHRRAVQATPICSPRLPSYMNSLAVALRARYLRTSQLPDLDEAITTFRQAVDGTLEGAPELPSLLNNLGNALRRRYERTKESDDLRQALSNYQKAVNTAPGGSPDLPLYLNNLGLGLVEMYQQGGNRGDLEEGVSALRKALHLAPPDTSNLSGIFNNLAAALAHLCAPNEALSKYLEALEMFRRAVETIPESSPDFWFSLYNLGTFLQRCYGRTSEVPYLEEAVRTLERACFVLEKGFSVLSATYKIGQQRNGMQAYESLVAANLQWSAAVPSDAKTARRRAFEVVERSKSQLLIELLGRDELPLPNILSGYTDLERDLLNEIRTIDTAELAAFGDQQTLLQEASRSERLKRRTQCVQRLDGMWREMAQLGSEAADYVSRRRGDQLDWNSFIRTGGESAPGTAFVSFFTMGNHSLLIVTREGWEEPSIIETGLDWADIFDRFFSEVHAYDGIGRRRQTWDRSIVALLERAAPALAGAEQIVLSPDRMGFLLPWASLALKAGWRRPDGSGMPIITLPGLGVLPRLRRRPTLEGGSVLVVGNPTGNLSYAEHEAREVANLLGVAPLIGRDATKQAALEALSKASIVHLATHAFFSPHSPLDSGIRLSDGILTAKEIITHRLGIDLLVLSACQTGMAAPLGGGELAGLGNAFLSSGVRSLVLSLWAVNDRSTAALMLRFYDALRAGSPRAQALSQAMAVIEAEEKWSHLYYWGAFVYMGSDERTTGATIDKILQTDTKIPKATPETLPDSWPPNLQARLLALSLSAGVSDRENVRRRLQDWASHLRKRTMTAASGLALATELPFFIKDVGFSKRLEITEALLGVVYTLKELFPLDASIAEQLSRGFSNVALAYCEVQQLDRAIPLINELRSLRRSFPSQLLIAEQLAKAMYNAALGHCQLKHTAEVDSFLQEIRSLQSEFPAEPFFAATLSSSLADAISFYDRSNNDRAKSLVEQLRVLRMDFSQHAFIASELARGLANIIGQYGKDQIDQITPLLGELRALHLSFPEQMILGECLARGLVNSAFRYGELRQMQQMEALLSELRSLQEVLPKQPKIAEALAIGLSNATATHGQRREQIQTLLRELDGLRKAFSEEQPIAAAESRGLVNAIVSAHRQHRVGELPPYLEKLDELTSTFPAQAALAVAQARGLVEAISAYGELRQMDRVEVFLQKLRALEKVFPEEVSIARGLARCLLGAAFVYEERRQTDEVEIAQRDIMEVLGKWPVLRKEPPFDEFWQIFGGP